MWRKQDSISAAASTLCLLLVCFAILGSCSLFSRPESTADQRGNGAMLLRHGAWLYRIGGKEDANLISADSKMAVLDENGSISDWQSTASLPAGIHHGAALSAGSLVYVIGGMAENGLSTAIYYTLAASNGALGFGANHYWEINLRPLPEARAFMAWAFFDGWIFLIGGETSSGATKSIIRARIYQDGQIGQWYESSQSLPNARWGSAATVLGNRLYVAGGANAHGVAPDIVSFALGDYGALSDRRIEPNLPLALQEAVLIADRDDLLLAGGSGVNGWSKKIYRNHGGTWSRTSLTAEVEGPCSGRAGESIYCLPSPVAKGLEAVRIDGLSAAPESPVVVSGSGMVPNNSPVAVDEGPGLAVHYRKDGGIPTIADALWPDASIRISTANLPSMELSLAAFRSDGTSSPVVHRAYAVRAGSFFVILEDTLQIHASQYASLDCHIMQESGSEGTAPTAASSLWYRMLIDVAGNYRLAWADADEDPAYSARLIVSVYEVDLYTEVPDLSELPSRDKRGGLAAPLRLALNPGDYYVWIRDMDGQEGRNFGLSLVKE